MCVNVYVILNYFKAHVFKFLIRYLCAGFNFMAHIMGKDEEKNRSNCVCELVEFRRQTTRPNSHVPPDPCPRSGDPILKIKKYFKMI